jgi:hypothetical protein
MWSDVDSRPNRGKKKTPADLFLLNIVQSHARSKMADGQIMANSSPALSVFISIISLAPS